MALSSSKNSTNVRNDSPLDPWPRARPASRAPFVVLAAWSAFVAAAARHGVFARLEVEAYSALAVLIVAVALLATRVDAELAALLAGIRRALILAAALDALLLAGAMAIARSGDWSGIAGAMLTLVALPLALVLNAEALRRPRVRKAPGASPGATRAAT